MLERGRFGGTCVNDGCTPTKTLIATAEVMTELREASELGVKASGGVKGLDDARKMVEAGATRIGASVGVKIAQEAAGKSTSEVRSQAY